MRSATDQEGDSAAVESQKHCPPLRARGQPMKGAGSREPGGGNDRPSALQGRGPRYVDTGVLTPPPSIAVAKSPFHSLTWMIFETPGSTAAESLLRREQLSADSILHAASRSGKRSNSCR